MADQARPSTGTRKKISKDMIGDPTNFNHVAHVGNSKDLKSFYEERNEETKNVAVKEIDIKSTVTGSTKLNLDVVGGGGEKEMLATSPAATNSTGGVRAFKLLVQPRTAPPPPPKKPNTPNNNNNINESSNQQHDETEQSFRKLDVSKIHHPNNATSSNPTAKSPTSQTKPPLTAVSLTTVERSIATKIYFERYFDSALTTAGPAGRTKRKMQLEEALASMDIADTEKNAIRQSWAIKERENLRRMRERTTINDFDLLKIVGHGAFGVVRIVRERSTGEVYAMKILRKVEMLKKNQEAHVRTERDLLAEASEVSNWIVRLIYSFQDTENLYFVMEYLPGGDLLTLLIKMDVFDESFARHYAAQMVLAIEEAHKLGIIHRDVKPDNFLFDSDGYIKLADFGLATDFHWAHDAEYYKEQRRVTLLSAQRSTGFLDDEEIGAGTPTRASSSIPPGTVGGGGGVEPGDDGNSVGVPADSAADILGQSPYEVIRQWRDKNRRKKAFSVVGTNNYIAPEVLLGTGYDKSCDWWSLGVIVYEMLFGYPPFCSKNRQQTRLKIINWKQTLRFPTNKGTNVSAEARDFILRLCCEPEKRLGRATIGGGGGGQDASGKDEHDDHDSTGIKTALSKIMRHGDADDLRNHAWFKDINWSTIENAPNPFKPILESDVDTAYFEDLEEEEVLKEMGIAPATAVAAANKADVNGEGVGGGDNKSAQPVLSEEEQALIEMRKKMAFVGFTYKAPKGAKPNFFRDLDKSTPPHQQ